MAVETTKDRIARRERVVLLIAQAITMVQTPEERWFRKARAVLRVLENEKLLVESIMTPRPRVYLRSGTGRRNVDLG